MDLNGSKWPSPHMTYDTEKSAIGHSPLANQRCFSSTFSKLFWAWASVSRQWRLCWWCGKSSIWPRKLWGWRLKRKTGFWQKQIKNQNKSFLNDFEWVFSNGQHKKDRIASMVALQRTNLTTPRRERELQSEHTMNGFQHGPTLIPATPPQPAA